ncbi:MAG: NAD(P)-binding domain-containing protein, partial [Pseudomonadota bacterium]
MVDTVGFIGLGAMGGGMAANIVRAGFKVVVFDILPERVDVLTALGAEAANSPMAVAASSERTITMVETTAQTQAVIFGEAGIVQSAAAGHHIAMMSTIDPVATKRMHAELADKDIG